MNDWDRVSSFSAAQARRAIPSLGISMLNYTNYAYLRYVLLINIIAALVPAMRVKGRAKMIHCFMQHGGKSTSTPQF